MNVTDLTGAPDGPGEVIILRGLPGSGKSTRAAQIASEARKAAAAGRGAGADMRNVVAIHSTDSYFINPSGVYQFDAELLGVNHARNLEAFRTSLAAGVATIIVDNTNLQRWHYEKYVEAAWAAGYEVNVEVVGKFTHSAAAVYAARNTHGVPLDKILEMLEQWEEDENEEDESDYDEDESDE